MPAFSIRSLFPNANANNRSPRGLWATASFELILLAIVWLGLGVVYLSAHYGQSNKAQRYQLEADSYTAGVQKSTLLATACGATAISDINAGLSKTITEQGTSGFNLAQLCPIIANNPQQANGQAISQFSQIEQALAKAWQQQKTVQRRDKLIQNETEIQLGNDGLHSRQDWLNLNDSGQLDSLNQLQALNKAVFDLTSLSTNADNRNANPSQLDTATFKALTNGIAVDKANFATALLAVADGNRRFAFSKLFASQPQLATLFNQATDDVAGVYEANINQIKAQQALQLLPVFGDLRALGLLPQVLMWSLATWLLLMLSRQKGVQSRHPLLLLPMAMTVWGLVITLVSHDIILPLKFGLAVFCVGVLLTALGLFLPRQKMENWLPDNREVLSSPWLFALFVAFTTFGLLILVDLSSRSYLSLRYLFLAHFKDLFWAYVLVSLARPMAQLVSGGLKWLVASTLLQAIWGNQPSQVKKGRIWLVVMALGYLGLAGLFRHDSAKIAELGKMWLMVFLALFLAINQRALINNLFFKSKKMTALLLFALLLPVMALGIANEKGTILVMLFVMTFLVGVALSNRIFQMGGRGYILGVLSSTAMLLALMMVLVNLSGFDDRTAERVSTWMNPFASSNDQMAILHWFRESTPVLGFGFGDVPWCGYHLSGCQGVPLQMQSDYTITSVMAVLGMGASVVFIAVYVAWLVLMANRQLAFAGEQVKSRLLSGSYLLLAWVILVWVVITIFQAIVTISGNLGMLPLTGVTLPFLSYGTSSLWFNSVMLGLALFQPKLVVKRD